MDDIDGDHESDPQPENILNWAGEYISREAKQHIGNKCTKKCSRVKN